MDNTILSVRNINKSFGENPILRDVSLDIMRGEFLTLLGESGCGKTTTLRIIAGLETIDSGELLLDGVEISDYPPDKRNVNTVFQNYALFPHMNVFDNIAYGPKIRGVTKNDIKSGVMEMLALVKMEGYEKRMPHQLSGGQRQRVAIARALINKPLILLLDEPLGALDQKLRQHMQTELKSIQTQAGVTFVYVTHDQEEAMNMSDRMAVMNGGVFCQTGSPREIYERPTNLYTAGFVGDRNIIPVRVLEDIGGEYVCELAEQSVLAAKNAKFRPGDKPYLAVHTDKTLVFSSKPENGLFLKGKVAEKSYSGSRTRTVIELNPETRLTCIEYNVSSQIAPGDEVFVGFKPDDAVLV